MRTKTFDTLAYAVGLLEYVPLFGRWMPILGGKIQFIKLQSAISETATVLTCTPVRILHGNQTYAFV